MPQQKGLPLLRVAPGHFPGNGGFFMRGVGKKLAAVLALAGLLACAAFGAQSVPGAVLDARQSTVRIVAISGENVFYGRASPWRATRAMW